MEARVPETSTAGCGTGAECYKVYTNHPHASQTEEHDSRHPFVLNAIGNKTTQIAADSV